MTFFFVDSSWQTFSCGEGFPDLVFYVPPPSIPNVYIDELYKFVPRAPGTRPPVSLSFEPMSPVFDQSSSIDASEMPRRVAPDTWEYNPPDVPLPPEIAMNLTPDEFFIEAARKLVVRSIRNNASFVVETTLPYGQIAAVTQGIDGRSGVVRVTVSKRGAQQVGGVSATDFVSDQERFCLGASMIVLEEPAFMDGEVLNLCYDMLESGSCAVGCVGSSMGDTEAYWRLEAKIRKMDGEKFAHIWPEEITAAAH